MSDILLPHSFLFRGKRIDDGTWVEGSLYVTHYDRAGIQEDDYKIYDVWYGSDDNGFPTYQSGADESVDPSTVGMYIGVCDKHGRRIFEGDIVATQYGRLCKVEWFSSEMHQGWDLKPLEDMHSRPNESTLWRSDYLEVVGNIYDDGYAENLAREVRTEVSTNIIRYAERMRYECVKHDELDNLRYWVGYIDGVKRVLKVYGDLPEPVASGNKDQ